MSEASGDKDLPYTGRFTSHLATMGIAVTEDNVTLDNVVLPRNEKVSRADWITFWGSLERRLVCRPSA